MIKPFSFINEKYNSFIPFLKKLKKQKRLILKGKKDDREAYISIGFKLPFTLKDNEKEAYDISALCLILTNALLSELYIRLREHLGIEISG